MAFPEETYCRRLDAKGRTFFFDVKQVEGQSKRLVVTQSRKRDGVHERERLTVYEEDVAAFLTEIMNAVAAMGEPPSLQTGDSPSPEAADSRPSIGTQNPSAPVRYVDIRAEYPNAYRPWTPEDDEELIELEVGGMSVPDLARHFGRRSGAIRSRVRKLAVHGS